MIMQTKLNEAIKFLKTNISINETIFVGFSGGKDSIVTAEIMNQSGLNYELYYTATGIDPPEVVKFIKQHYPECKFLYPSKTFWHSVKTQNPPLIHARWCCTSLKKRPSWKIPLYHRVMGIRKEESSIRSKYERINHFSKTKSGRPEHIQYYPIFYWNEADIWEFIDSFNLKYPILYDMGFDRLGCVVCPYHSKNVHKFYKKHYPALFKIFDKNVKEWYHKRKSTGRTMANYSAEDFLNDWYNGKASWYAKKPKRIKLKQKK